MRTRLRFLLAILLAVPLLFYAVPAPENKRIANGEGLIAGDIRLGMTIDEIPYTLEPVPSSPWTEEVTFNGVAFTPAYALMDDGITVNEMTFSAAMDRATGEAFLSYYLDEYGTPDQEENGVYVWTGGGYTLRVSLDEHSFQVTHRME